MKSQDLLLLFFSCLIFIACSDQDSLLSEHTLQKEVKTVKTYDIFKGEYAEESVGNVMSMDQTSLLLNELELKLDSKILYSNISEIGKDWNKYIALPSKAINTKFITYTYENGTQTLIVDYELFEENFIGIYIYPGAESQLGPDPVKVECNGACRNENDVCTELYNPSTGIVGCACESDDCHMIITPMDPIDGN